MNQDTAVLNRESFTTDRTLEFFSEKELQMQIGHSRHWWPVAMVKELVDNALDACETAGILPEIEVTVEQDAVSVLDNGTGLLVKVLEQSLDYMIRVSDKSHYVSPTRGQLGNAMKCLWGVPFVMNGDSGRIDVMTSGQCHKIEVGLDRIAQKPTFCHTIENDGFVKNGTFIKMHLPGIAGLLTNPRNTDFYNLPGISDLISNYVAFNPHATFKYTGPDPDFNFRNDRRMAKFSKWLPSNPTSPHWYSVERLRGLIAAYVALEQSGGKVRTVRGFARGKLIEPHTNERVDLGTLAVRRYVKTWTNGCHISTKMSGSLSLRINTSGPVNRYRYALFVEKEGFDELWKSVELASRFDLAIMSTKGMSVTAARQLVAELSEKDVTILVLRDFDKAGFSIVHTLKSDTRRWQYETPPNIIDLGLRLSDVEEMNLESEDVTYDSNVNPRVNLLASGATQDEADYLVRGGRPKAWHGERVELNAMTSPQLVKWLESKLKQHGVAKVVPNDDTLAQAYKRAHYVAYVNKAIRKVSETYDETVSVPDDLSDRVRENIEGRSLSWDDAIGDIAGK